MQYNELNEQERYIIEQKGTERPFSGEYNSFYEEGIYRCKKCNAVLFSSSDKFDSHSGWPSFDDDLGNVKRVQDKDGRRVEIVCAVCEGHLGHVFEGERFTQKDTRHCVNSLSLNFEKEMQSEIKKAYFAAGCFWGVEYFFQTAKGVIKVTSGYMGGDIVNPTYEDVCSGLSGHLEVVEVLYDGALTTFEDLAKLFFEIHDFTQTNGQGPDIGLQYLSAIFYGNEQEQKEAIQIIKLLEAKKFIVATKLISLFDISFYKAEEYHQNYYGKNGKIPYCHKYIKIL